MLTLWLRPGVRTGEPYLLSCARRIIAPENELVKKNFRALGECRFILIAEQVIYLLGYKFYIRKEGKKMKIRVIGKAHLKGVSKKNGNPYDFIQIHYNGPAYGVTGDAALTANLDPARINFDSIAIPGDYNLEFDNRGFPVVFDPIPGK